MKIIVAGNYKWIQYQQALLDGFNSIGNDIKAYPSILKYYPVWNLFGVLVNTLLLWKDVKRRNPDVLFLYRVDSMLPYMLPILKKCYGIKVIVYHNDDPYRKNMKCFLKHFLFLKGIKYSDITYVYREVNILEAYEWGASRVNLMRAYYYTKMDGYNLNAKNITEKEKCVVFVGHYEDDSRIPYLDALFKSGVNVHIYGGSAWEKAFAVHKWPFGHLHAPVYNNDYRDRLSSAYAALAFFSEKNRDDYTRRCFEIPMARTLLLAPRTHFMEQTFSDNVNVVLFRDAKELVEKAKVILSSPQITSAISEAGYRFVLNGEFSELNAAQKIIKDLNDL